LTLERLQSTQSPVDSNLLTFSERPACTELAKYRGITKAAAANNWSFILSPFLTKWCPFFTSLLHYPIKRLENVDLAHKIVVMFYEFIGDTGKIATG
jgi:hypothetical protein